MLANITPDVSDAGLATLNPNSKPQEKLLKSFNIFDKTKPDELLHSLSKCINVDELPASCISENTDSQGFKGKYQSQSSTRETNQSLAVSVGVSGKYSVYSGSAQVDYSKSDHTTSTSFASSFVAKLTFGDVSYKLQSHQATLNLLDTDMVSQLRAINSMAKAKAFTDAWGTHLVTRVSLGGMLFVSMHAETGSEDQKQSLSVAVNQKYDSVVSLTTAAKVVTEISQSTSFKNVSQSVTAFGGSATAAAKVDPANPQTFENWINSCTKDTDYAISGTMEIFSLVDGTGAGTFLKRYIDLEMLAFSLEHPAIILEQKPIQAYIFNDAVATNKEGYKIIGGGAATSINSSSFLVGSYPQIGSDRRPTAWHAASHDIAYAADPRDRLSAYAIAVYDPDNYLEVTTVTATGTNPKIGGDSAVAVLGAEWEMTGGGINCGMNSGPCKYITGSYFTEAKSWKAQSSDYKVGATGQELKAYAIGLRSKDALLYIKAEQISGAVAFGQHGQAVAISGRCVCGGGVNVWDNKGMGNLVQIAAPILPTSWGECNGDLDGNVSPANYQAFAVVLDAHVVL